MAKRKINKSAAIRAEIDKHPKAGSSGIVQILAEQGIQVTAQLVSNVKARMAQGKGRGRKPGRPVGSSLTVAQLMVASDFARQMGGVEKAAAALATLERLR